MQQKQRELFAKSMMDLGNLVAVALVFGQFVTGQPFRPNPNTYDTSRQVIILRVGWEPVTNRVLPVIKTATSINSIS
jgi:hypothetical protein